MASLFYFYAMKRLYKFLALLFLALLFVSFIYGTLASWGTYKILQATAIDGVQIGHMSFSNFIKVGFVEGLIYSLVLLLMITSLLNRSVRCGRKFTLKNIIAVALWFYLATTIVFAVHIISYTSFSFTTMLLIAGPQFSFPAYLWTPFPLVWLSLFIILFARIKKAA
jgi:hypothetical protein